MGRIAAALLLLLTVVDAHTNAIGVKAKAATSGNAGEIDLLVILGTYHDPAPPQGGAALYGHNGGSDVDDATQYTVELYGQGGTTTSATYPMVTPADETTFGVTWSAASHTSGSSWTEAELTAKERRRLKRAGQGDAWEAAKKARDS